MPADQNLISLAEIIRVIPGATLVGPGDQIVTGIVFDSRQVKPGNIFVALVGGNVDGHAYISEAVKRGASAVVGMMALEGLSCPYFQVDDTRYTLAALAAAFYGFPARQLTVIGVTGTDGKTTTSNLIYHILQSAGVKTGMISTVNAVIGEKILDTGFHVTTPESPDVQRYLAEMVRAGLETAILEATSHGLDQRRLSACDFDVGVVTNITHEHLDYHGSYPAYRAAKARLFTALAETPEKVIHSRRGAVLNRDDSAYEYLSDLCKVRQVSYSTESQADVMAGEVEYLSNGMRFTVFTKTDSGENVATSLKTNLIGTHNLSNILAALTTCVRILRIPADVVQHALETFPGVPGRMETITFELADGKQQEFATIVDFAHTPNALRNTLETARKISAAKVIVVFGSAGLRDRAKRQMMAETAIAQADLSILTAEDPRTESLDLILEEMAEGARNKGGVEGKNFWRVSDRGDAIRFALTLASPGDLVIVCGKGHEQSMCFGEIEYPWDDRIAMRAALAEYCGIPGPAMPTLPTSKHL